MELDEHVPLCKHGFVKHGIKILKKENKTINQNSLFFVFHTSHRVPV